MGRLKKILKKAGKILIYFVLIVISFVFLRPIFEIISKTFMSADDVIDPAVEWIPKSFSIQNIKIAANVLKYSKTLNNTILFSGVMALCQTVVAALTGYALSRFNFRLKRFWFVMILLAFIIPTPVLMVPRLMMIVSFQEAIKHTLIGTIYPQLFMAMFGQGIYSTVLILIFNNFFNLIPKSLDEAAMIDGAGPFKVFFHIVIRMSVTTILIVFLFSFVWNWNETYITGTFLRNKIELLPAKLALFNSEFDGAVSASGSAFKLNEAYKMAATFLSILPLLVLYAFVQKRFIQGIENTGITGE